VCWHMPEQLDWLTVVARTACYKDTSSLAWWMDPVDLVRYCQAIVKHSQRRRGGCNASKIWLWQRD